MSAIGRLTRLLGTMSTYFRIGGTGGPQFKRNGAVMELRDTSDAGFAIIRGATPVADNDLVTKAYVDQQEGPKTVVAQFDGNNALPANTGVERFLVVTTTGAHASIGDLLWDDGSGAGTMTLLPAADARQIFTTAEFTGGTISLDARTYYTWSTGAGAWVEYVGPQVSGAVREIRYVIGTGATQASASKIPANAQITDVQLVVTTPYDGGTTIEIGRTGSPALVMATTDNNPTVANTYAVPQDTAWGGAELAVVATIAGGPVAGAAVVIVRFTEPNL